MKTLPLSVLTLTLGLGLAGCPTKSEETHRAPPPPVASAKPGACAEGGGTIADKESAPFLPKTTGAFCLDPNGGSMERGAAITVRFVDAQGTLRELLIANTHPHPKQLFRHANACDELVAAWSAH